MTDESTQQANITEQPKEITVSISIPETITAGMRQAYITGRKRYENAAILKGEEPDEDGLSRYYGVLELIKRGFVHVTGLDALKHVLDSDRKVDEDSVSGDVIVFLVRNVALTFEARFAYPLVWKASLSR